MIDNYDVIIIGAGPAGIFAARELYRNSTAKVLLLEKGRLVDKRSCPVNEGASQCIHCQPCSIMSGWGGAGAFSDGKLTLTTEFGGWLGDYIGKEKLADFIDYVDKIYLEHGASTVVYGQNEEEFESMRLHMARVNLKLLPARIRHMGTDNTLKVLQNLKNELDPNITIKTGETVQDILVEGGRARGVITKQGTYYAPRIICAPGRDGAQWFSEQMQKLNIPLSNNQVDIGVRVELPAVTMQDFTDKVYEPKIVYNTKEFDDLVRTFCVNPNGHVVMENTNGIITVNGHSYAGSKSNNSNFALLLSQEFTEPFDQPVQHAQRRHHCAAFR
jgi:uncharacterized FAD-dependent dehydrogenase